MRHAPLIHWPKLVGKLQENSRYPVIHAPYYIIPFLNLFFKKKERNTEFV